MKRFPAIIFIVTSCVLALAGGSGCRTVWKKKTVTAPPAAAVDRADRAPERKGWLARMFSRKAEAPSVAPDRKAAATNQPPAVIENPNKAALIYRIQINDQVIITLSGIPMEQRFDVVVDEHGYIKLPYIENIKAEGKTSSELETMIRDSYLHQQIYKRITVNVALPNQLQTYYYYVQGEVRGVGGRMPWVIGMTIMRGLAAAGGPNEFASSRIQVTRAGKTFTVNTSDVARHPEKDQPLLPGDVIVVPKSFL